MDQYILPFLWMKGESPEIIRREIEKISNCGIGAVCLESRPHPDFMGDRWWSDVNLIIEECKKRGMRVWILDDTHFPTGFANGLVRDKYPERRKWYLAYSTCDVWGSRGEVSIPAAKMMHPTFSFLDLGKPRNEEEEKNNEMISVSAYRLVQGDQVDETSVIDLTGQMKDGWIHITLPAGSWRVFAVYKTRNGGENSDYLNPIDSEAVSTLIEAIYEPHYEHLKEEFGKTIAGFFSDEPGFYNKGGFGMDERIGHKEMVLPWSSAAAEEMEKVCGADYKKLLPLLWTPSVQDRETARMRYRYMDVVSDLYSRCFSRQLGDWCHAHGVEYIGHVLEDDNVHARLGAGAGHYFRAMAGQHMAGIDVISQQISCGGEGLRLGGVFRRDCEFNHYALGKMGASAGHLDPKKQGRTMCELFGAYGWRLGVRDMKWILDHLLTKGVNYFVPHAFSMAEYPDEDCPPHFHAGGHYAQCDDFAVLMKYANRMCGLLNGGQHVAHTALLYHGEHEWAGEAMLMQKPARELIQHQIDFDIVSLDMLTAPEQYNGSVGDTDFTLNGITFKALVVPYAEKVSSKLMDFHRDHPGVPMIFTDDYPAAVVEACGDAGITVASGADTTASAATAAAYDLQKIFEQDASVSRCALGQLGEYLESMGACDMRLDQPFPLMAYYHYRKNGTDCYLFHNENMYEEYSGAVYLPLRKGAVLYDGMEDRYYRLPVAPGRNQNEKKVSVEIPVYGLCVILDMEAAEDLPAAVFAGQQMAEAMSIDLSGGWRYSLRKEISRDHIEAEGTLQELIPMSRLYPGFSGHILYEREFELEEMPISAWLEAEYVFETAKVTVNGQEAGRMLCPPYRMDISGLLNAGVNHLSIEVTTTMDRDQIGRPEPFFTLDYQPVESTGMYGNITLRFTETEQ